MSDTLAVPGFPLIEVAGSSYEMGSRHGTQAAHLIERHVRWIELLTGLPRDRLAQQALAFAAQAEAFSPSLMEEIRGLAAGARISLGEALLCQVRTEAAQVGQGGCTLFALTGSATADGEPLVGQNQDMEPEWAEVAMLLRVQPGDGRPSALMLTFAGQIGYAGMNQHGLAHFNASLYGYQWQPGVPRQLMKRVMLEKRTVEECAALLARHRVCSAASMMLCDGRGSLASVEIRPDRIASFEGQHADCLLHTNHYLTPEFAACETGFLPDSRPRLARVQDLIRQSWGRITVETMKAILADHEGHPAGICRHGTSGWQSIAGYIAEPTRRLLHVRHGHGCLGVWQTYAV
jgi:isopenicillin-N N-acyltransferase-like protein